MDLSRLERVGVIVVGLEVITKIAVVVRKYDGRGRGRRSLARKPAVVGR
jgi:hypothetical protein